MAPIAKVVTSVKRFMPCRPFSSTILTERPKVVTSVKRFMPCRRGRTRAPVPAGGDGGAADGMGASRLPQAGAVGSH